jgi:Arc/MetJ family transcription regulator
MRTNIVIDDDLMAEAMRTTGFSTKGETVELALKTLVRLKRQERVRGFRGKLTWEGDPYDQRSTR